MVLGHNLVRLPFPIAHFSLLSKTDQSEAWLIEPESVSRNHGRESYEEKKPISGATISKLGLPGDAQAPKLRSVGRKQGQSKEVAKMRLGKWK